jgi:GcrA cell cycle regulator
MSYTGKKNAATANWTDERTARLTELWTEGLSCSQIARELGGDITRNAVIGKVTRLNLPRRRDPAHKATRSTRARRPRVGACTMSVAVRLGNAKKAGVQSLDEALSHIKARPIPGAAWDALPDTTPISLLMLSDETCRWPIGDPLLAGFGFCGCPVEAGRVYCPTHRALGTTQFKATAEDKRKLERMDTSRRVFA